MIFTFQFEGIQLEGIQIIFKRNNFLTIKEEELHFDFREKKVLPIFLIMLQGSKSPFF